MLYATTSNFLVLEDGKLPLPPEIKSYVADAEIQEIVWNSAGLPVHGGTYCISSGMLYFEGLVGQDTKIEAQDFTGEVVFGSFFRNPDSESKSHQVNFIAVFVKGKLDEIKVDKVIPIDTAAFNKRMEDAQDKIGRKIRRRNSWWYKYLYTPYFVVVRFIGLCGFLALQAINWLLTKIILFLTPI
jgi:hypothetical protein